jgi:phage protein D
MERFAPTFMIQIEGEQLSSDITQRITRFVYEDCEDQDDLLEITLEGGFDLVDNPLLQEGNIIKARWGYVDEWSNIKECILKEPEYDFSNVVPSETTTILWSTSLPIPRRRLYRPIP